MAAGELAQTFVKTLRREHHAAVGERRLGKHTGDVTMGKRVVELIEIVEIDHPGGRLRRLDDAHAAVPPDHPSIDQVDGGLSQAAVVAAVEHQDLWPPRDLAREPAGKAVGIGRGEREAPVLQPETPLQFRAEPQAVLGGQHLGDALPHFPGGNVEQRLRRVAEHCTRVPEAEIGELVAVDVDELRPGCALDVNRERALPLPHPGNRSAAKEVLAGLDREATGGRMPRRESILLAAHQGRDRTPIHGPHRTLRFPLARQPRQSSSRQRIYRISFNR